MVTAENIKDWIEAALQGSQVQAEGDGRHFAAEVVCAAFADKSTLERHRMVYEALGDKMKSDIHALSLKTYTPQELEVA